MVALFGLIFLVVALVALAPLGTLAARLFESTGWWASVVDPSTLHALWQTIKITFSSLFLGLALSLPVSWWTIRSDIPGARFFRRAFVFGYVVPPYLYAIAWIMLAVPEIGLMNRLLGNYFNIYSFGGLVWAFTMAYMPILLSALWSGMRSMDPSLEEAARVSGASPFFVFWKITLPCLLPAIGSAALLFLLATMSAFGLPAMLGAPARLNVLTTKIFSAAKMGGISGIDRAFAMSLWLVLITVILIFANDRIRKRYQQRLTSGKAARPSKIQLGKWKLPIFGFVALLVTLSVFLPLSAVLLSSFLRIAGEISFANFTLGNYHYLFAMEETGRAIVNSLWLATATGIICLAIGFFVSYFRDRSTLPGNHLLQRISTVPFAIPGTVMALAMIVSFGTGWGVPELALLGSPLLLLIAYVAKDLALAVQSLTPAISSIDHSLDEAARVCGASRMGVLKSILVPLLRPAMGSIFFLTALPALSELTMSVLLAGPGTETLGTLLFQLQDYANPLAACALASMMLSVLALTLLRKDKST